MQIEGLTTHLSEAPEIVQRIWQRAAAQGWSGPVWQPEYGLFARVPYANFFDNPLQLCGADGAPFEGGHRGNPCIYCNKPYQAVGEGPCPGETT